MDWQGIWKCVLAAIVMGASIDVIYQFMVVGGVSDAVATFGVMCLAAIIYGAVLLLLGGVTERDVSRMPFFGSRLSQLLTRLGLLK